MLTLDGSMGEGGGQVLRTALTLSLITGTAFRIRQIRGRRRRPGLLRQHLTAVRAAAEIGGATVEGDRLGSSELVFRPRTLRPGHHRFAVGSAGSATLVAQTVIPALMTQEVPSVLQLAGGTHNPFAPPFEFLDRVLLPLLVRTGVRIRARLHRPGFFPAGGGSFEVTIDAPGSLRPLELVERGRVLDVTCGAVVAGLPRGIAEREVETVARRLGLGPGAGRVEEWPQEYGPGNVVSIEIRSEALTEIVTGFGRRGVPAETVAGHAAEEAARYVDRPAPVGEHLADQLLLPLAMIRGGTFRTGALTPHAVTNLEVIHRFVSAAVRVESDARDCCRVEVARAGD